MSCSKIIVIRSLAQATDRDAANTGIGSESEACWPQTGRLLCPNRFPSDLPSVSIVNLSRHHHPYDFSFSVSLDTHFLYLLSLTSYQLGASTSGVGFALCSISE